MPQSRYVLRARGVRKSYGPIEVLSGVTASIHAGETVAIMGPSGSGKTTLLHVLAGILTPEFGSVDLHSATDNESTDITALTNDERSALRLRKFGFVFQQGLLLPELTAIENVMLPLLMIGSLRAQARHLAREMLMRLGLVGLDHRRIGQLSGGQVQRVAIARALVHTPQVVFADEPTGALDSRSAHEVLDRLLDLTSRAGSAIVLVTHAEHVASRCDRILNLLDGRILDEAQR